MPVDDALFERALRTYVGVLSVAEPIRLRLWDSRGLTMTQLRALFTLLGQDGATVGTLAEMMGLGPSTVTGITNRLVRARLISRRADPRDRRRVRIYLTAEGHRLLDEIDMAGRVYVSAIVQRLGREKLETLIQALEEFLAEAKAIPMEGTQT